MKLFKTSPNPGAVPNLIPGQVGINLADAILYLRSQGRKLAVPIQKVATQAAPANGPIGAPIGWSGSGVTFVEALTPSSIVNGVIPVDAPPAGLGVPGFSIAALSEPQALGAGQTLVEPFTVASSDFVLRSIAFDVATGAGAMTVAIANAAGALVLQQHIVKPVAGSNSISVAQALPPGQYLGVIGCATATSLAQVSGFRSGQGWSYPSGTTPMFQARAFGPMLPLPNAVSIQSTQSSPTPGELRSLLYSWTLT